MFRRTLWTITLSALLFGGCAPGNTGLLILNVVAPDDSCLYAVGNPQHSSGVLDVAPPPGYDGGGYVAFFRFGNQLLNLSRTGSSGPAMADPNVMQVQQLEVELQDVGGTPLALGGPNPYTVPAGGGVVPSSDGSAAGEALGSAELIPAVYIPDLVPYADSDIVVSIKAIGTTLGGAEVVSYPFVYPIHLCAGCLFGCAYDADMAAVCSPTCNPGQDRAHITPDQCGVATVCQVGGT